MQEAKSYRQYAADCRRLAQTMSAKDREVLLEMALAWESRAQDAERMQTKKNDGQGYVHGK